MPGRAPPRWFEPDERSVVPVVAEVTEPRATELDHPHDRTTIVVPAEPSTAETVAVPFANDGAGVAVAGTVAVTAAPLVGLGGRGGAQECGTGGMRQGQFLLRLPPFRDLRRNVGRRTVPKKYALGPPLSAGEVQTHQPRGVAGPCAFVTAGARGMGRCRHVASE